MENRAESFFLKLLSDIHSRDPNHEMFGPLEAGHLRAPYEPTTRKNGTSWQSVIKSIARTKYLYPIQLESNDCWMSKTSSVKLTKQENRKTVLLKSVKTVRLLAFLIDPSDENWVALKDGIVSLSLPFDHFCQRGECTDPDQNGFVCVNGFKHGVLSKRDANESRKFCKNGALCLCPGHGFPKMYCIFTHGDGRIKPCCNQRNSVPICTCSRRCYPPDGWLPS